MRSVIICSRETETTRNIPVSRPMRQRQPQSYPARVTGPLHPHSKSGVREVVTIRIAALVAGGRIVASIRCSEHLNPPAIHFQSAVLPADTGALRRFLSVARLRFNLSRLIRLPGSLIPSLRVQPAKQSRGGFSKCFWSFSSVLSHVLKHEAGGVQGVGHFTQELGKSTHERH